MRISARTWLFSGLLFFTPLLPNDLKAQDVSLLRGGGGFIGVGVRALDVSDLNSILDRNGYPTFQRHVLAFGGGGYLLRERILFGAEGYGLTSQREDRSDGEFSTRLTGGFGTLNVGYLASHSERLSVYPMLGVGGAGIQLAIDERSAPTFDEILQNPGRGSDLATASLVVTMSLGADYLLSPRRGLRRRGAGRVSGLVAGFRAGYSASLASGEWMQHDAGAAAGPEIGINGFFVTFTLGGRSLRGGPAF
jgi:hypothetical protein